MSDFAANDKLIEMSLRASLFSQALIRRPFVDRLRETREAKFEGR